MVQDNKSLNPQKAFITPIGQNLILDYMREQQLPLTRETYLAIEGFSEPLHPELEMELPMEFRLTSKS